VLKDIVSVQTLGGHKVRLRFEDGVEGVIDIASVIPFSGVFAPLSDPAFFERVAVLEEHGTIGWPNGADLDPDVLYSLVCERPAPSYGEDPTGRQP
jgi:hypothetical protein